MVVRSDAAGLRRRLAWPRGGVLVGAIGVGFFLWRVLAWPSAQSPDAWAYLTWGGAVVHGDEPAFGLTWTAPKPLGTLLGAVLWPLPPARAFDLLVAVALGVLLGALFAAAHRRGGPAAGLVAVAVFLPLGRTADVLAFAFVDVLIGALVALSFAVRGGGGVAALLVAGLARPEAWLVAGFAGLTESRGRLRRRLLAAGVCAAAAPLAWILFDLAVAGDPLLTIHRSHGIQEDRGREVTSWATAGTDALHSVPGGPAVAVAVLGAGLLGLVLHVRGRWRDRDALLPLATVVLWLAVIALETRFGLRINHRYLLPVLVPLALGVGLLAARFVPSRSSHGPAYVALGSAAVALWAVAIEPGPSATRWAEHVRAVVETASTLERVLPCGRVVVAGRDRPSPAFRGELAAASRRSPRDFVAEPGGRRAAVLSVEGTSSLAPPGWRRRPTPLGVLSVSPACAGRLVPPP